MKIITTYWLIIFGLNFIHLTSCFTKVEKTYNSKLAIQNFLIEKTNLNIDTSNFNVIIDSIHNTEGAFDLDYNWFVEINFNSNYFQTLKKSIRSTDNFCLIKHQYSESWSKIDTSIIKGIWTEDSVNLLYFQKPGNYSEPFILSVDTTTKIFKIRLTHL